MLPLTHIELLVYRKRIICPPLNSHASDWAITEKPLINNKAVTQTDFNPPIRFPFYIEKNERTYILL